MRRVVLAAVTLSSCASPPGGEGDGSDTGAGSGESGGETGAPACAAGPWELGRPIPRPELPAGDPAAGYQALLTEDYVSCGIPWALFGVAEGVLGVEEPLPGRAGRNAEVGHGWNVVTLGDGSELVVSNCLQCHAGHFNGELIVGLGKASADFTGSLADLTAGLPDLPETSEANAAFNKFKARAAALGPYSTMRTIGANPAVMFAIVLLSHRDPVTLAWSEAPRQELSTELVIPSDPPPWWRVGKKASHFANGMSRGDHRGTMVLASSVCADSVEEAGPVVEYFADIQAYVASIEAPRYPFAVDAALAEEGREVFECACAGCHGTYDEDPAAETFPNLLVPLEVIGTDPTFAALAAEGGFYHYLRAWFNSSFYGMFSEVVTDDPGPGYTAPPLDGIWATAPFLHNGSVPSLALVLDSQARPDAWRRVDYDSTNFDQAALGWPWTPTTRQADAPAGERKYIHDASLPGYGNGGHTFGDALDADERRAVLEYLKTL
jgi:mono/diheme cytochrome c family protein